MASIRRRRTLNRLEIIVAQAKAGDSVKIHYKGSLEDGTVFDSSHDGEPFNFTVGGGMVIPGFDKAVIGMEEGAVKTVSVDPDDGYGEYIDENVLEVSKDQIPEDITPEIGMGLQLHSNDGRTINVTVSKIDDDKVMLDGNHPLAGKTLTFEITLVEIVTT
jgi:FKBP-type peptidyl-prolyl cis-trans isomerase 2